LKKTRRSVAHYAFYGRLGGPQTGAMNEERRGVALMLAAGGVLGTLGVCLERAGQPEITAVWFRCAFGALALAAWAAAGGRWRAWRLTRRTLPAVAATGVLVVLNWLLFFGAVERTSIGVATVVVHVQPLLLMGGLAAWRREKLVASRWIAVAAAFGGLVLATGLVGGDVARGDAVYLVGLAMAVGAAITYAGVTLLAGAAGCGALALAGWQCVIGCLLLTPLLAAGPGWPAFGPAWGWLAALGVVHTGLAYVLLYGGLARLPAARSAPLLFAYPFAAIVVDRIVYGHVLDAWQWAGVLLLGAALLVNASARPAPHASARPAPARSPAHRASTASAGSESRRRPPSRHAPRSR
jgi:drug/metabolite transporter (DMT)-like permease